MGMWDSILNWFAGGGDKTKAQGYQGLIAALLGLGGGYLTYKDAKEAAEKAGGRPSSGYQGTIPEYTAYRESVPMYNIADQATAYDPNRRPGSTGRRYFTPTEFIGTPAYNYVEPDIADQAEGETDEAYTARVHAARAEAHEAARTEQQTGLQALLQGAQERANTQKWNSVAQNIGNPAKQAPYSNVGNTTLPPGIPALPPVEKKPPYAHQDIYKVLNNLVSASQTTPYGTTRETVDTEEVVGAAKGGLMGMYLGGPTDGMADNIPARIEGGQEARLSDGEFVLPADVVSHLGNGNSDAGAKVLHGMMDKIRKARTGTAQQGKRINPNKLIPR
jgi:hypothetical protein